MVEVIKNDNIKSISIPPLGCGNEGLNWQIVKSMMLKYLGNLEDVEIVIYQPNEKIKELLQLENTKKKLS